MTRSGDVLRGAKAVFFDAGGTLFRPCPSVGHYYSKVASRYGCKVGAKSGAIEPDECADAIECEHRCVLACECLGQRREGWAFDQFHDAARAVVAGDDGADGDDVGMVNGGGEAELAFDLCREGR